MPDPQGRPGRASRGAGESRQRLRKDAGATSRWTAARSSATSIPNRCLSVFVRADVVSGEAVRAAEAAVQHVLRGPAPDAAHARQALDRRAIPRPCERRKVAIVGDDRPAVSMIVCEVGAKTRSVRLDLRPGDARRRILRANVVVAVLRSRPDPTPTTVRLRHRTRAASHGARRVRGSSVPGVGRLASVARRLGRRGALGARRRRPGGAG
jgi:hypothetical protein